MKEKDFLHGGIAIYVMLTQPKEHNDNVSLFLLL